MDKPNILEFNLDFDTIELVISHADKNILNQRKKVQEFLVRLLKINPERHRYLMQTAVDILYTMETQGKEATSEARFYLDQYFREDTSKLLSYRSKDTIDSLYMIVTEYIDYIIEYKDVQFVEIEKQAIIMKTISLYLNQNLN